MTNDIYYNESSVTQCNQTPILKCIKTCKL